MPIDEERQREASRERQRRYRERCKATRAADDSDHPALKLVTSSDAPASPRTLRAALRAAMEGLSEVSAEKIARLLDVAIERGDVNALKLLATFSGIGADGSELEAPPAIAIVLEPFEEEVREEYERRIRAGEIGCPCGRIEKGSAEPLPNPAPVHESAPG